MKKNKKTKDYWFKAVRGSYLPSSPVGFVIYLTYCAYLVAVLVTWYQNGHKIWQFLSSVIPLTIGSALITQFIASRHSK